MDIAAVDAVIDGLKRAGVDFVSLMPDSDFSVLQERVVNDADFTYVPVSNEAIGVGVCVGAWLSGKRPALLVPTSGLLVAAWPLTSLCMAWSLPLLLLIPYRGDIGDAFWLMGPYKDTTEPLLKVLNAPYSVISKNEEISSAIVDAQGSTISWQRPVAVLLTGATINCNASTACNHWHRCLTRKPSSSPMLDRSAASGTRFVPAMRIYCKSIWACAPPSDLAWLFRSRIGKWSCSTATATCC